MKDEIETTIKVLLKRIQSPTESDAGAMQLSQAVLNLTHVQTGLARAEWERASAAKADAMAAELTANKRQGAHETHP